MRDNLNIVMYVDLMRMYVAKPQKRLNIMIESRKIN